MCSRLLKRGFTLIELLVVIAIIAILASILFPVFQKARIHALKVSCTSQVRQLAMAVQMYAQDNGNRFPGAAWNTAIENYAGTQKIFFCPADAANDKTRPISYGYSGLLVRADGTGCNEAQVRAPSEVGAIADATPSRAWADGGGLIGGGALVDPTSAAANTAVELEPRHGGVVVGFCDGHAKFFPGKQANLKAIDYGPGRAFYQAVGLGLVQNYGGGIQLPNAPTGIAPVASTITIGGDYATMPIVAAAAEVWMAKGGKVFTRGFKGAGDVTNVTVATAKNADWRRALAGAQFVWGIADNRVQTITPPRTRRCRISPAMPSCSLCRETAKSRRAALPRMTTTPAPRSWRRSSATRPTKATAQMSTRLTRWTDTAVRESTRRAPGC
ncbi:MAG: putative major pilin subunit [bacterium ADurb.Bin429]|nr:MAG: putative major pilin subunit [bacterium ADurb.Bin429]